AVWLEDRDRIAVLLDEDGWSHTPEQGEDGYTVYGRAGVRLELAFLARGDDGRVYTPLRDGQASWPEATFGEDAAELLGMRARIVGLDALRADKAEARADPAVAAKD